MTENLIIIFSLGSFVFLGLGIMTWRIGLNHMDRAIKCHQDAKELLDSCKRTHLESITLREEAAKFMESGRAYWVMAQQENQGDDWKEA